MKEQDKSSISCLSLQKRYKFEWKPPNPHDQVNYINDMNESAELSKSLSSIDIKSV